MRFDWYQATIDEEPRAAVMTIAKLGHELRAADGLAKRYHFNQGWAVHHNQKGVVAHVFAGGNGARPHAFASAEATDEFVDLVRTEWADRHLVTRMDAAEDFNEEGAFDRIHPLTRRIAKKHRLTFTKYEDELHPMAGRTQYIGSPSSDYRGRLYEKGWEQVAKLLQGFKKPLPADCAQHVTTIRNEVTGEDVRPQDWTRLELQVRPRHEEGKRRAATATPEEAWAFSDWTTQLAEQALALQLERITIRTRKISSDEQSLRWMCKHYGALLHRLRQDLGDADCVGREIFRILDE